MWQGKVMIWWIHYLNCRWTGFSAYYQQRMQWEWVPIPSLGLDLTLIEDNIINSVASATMAGYRSAWFLWLTFLDSLSEKHCAFSEKLIILLLNHLFLQIYSWPHVNKVMSGIFLFQITEFAALFKFFLG